MQALVGFFIVYIVRLKPLMYLYYVRYYTSPAYLFPVAKVHPYFVFTKHFEENFHFKCIFLPFPNKI